MNHPLNTTLLDGAITFAVQAHAGTERRGKGFPYIVHPLEAVSIVATITTDQELLAAAALHDVIEDTDITADEIRNRFGDRVARLVVAESDLPGGAWRERKQAAIDRIAAAPWDAKVVAMGDKLSNMRAIARDYDVLGDDLWDRFHAPDGRKDHEWHYRGLAQSLFALSETEAYKEFVTLIDHVFDEEHLQEATPVNLGDYVESGGGFLSVSYNHKDGITMAKFYGEDVGVPAQELLLARRVYLMGLPTPAAKRLVTDGQRYGAEFRRITPKESFARYISNRPDGYEDIAIRFAHMCRRLHTTDCNTAHFESVTDYYIKIIGQSAFTEMEKEKMRLFVRSVPVRTTCLHGDLHIGNVITTGGPLSTEGQQLPVYDLWIDLGDFRWGNPLYDLGMFYLVTYTNSEEMTQNLYHISNAQMREVWRIFAAHYAGADTTEKLAAFEAQVRPFAALRMVLFTLKVGMIPDMVGFIRDNLLLTSSLPCATK